MGLSLAEIARKLGVATSGIAMAVRREERRGESDESEQRPLDPRPLDPVSPSPFQSLSSPRPTMTELKNSC